jgi:hypothetical protein
MTRFCTFCTPRGNCTQRPPDTLREHMLRLAWSCINVAGGTNKSPAIVSMTCKLEAHVRNSSLSAQGWAMVGPHLELRSDDKTEIYSYEDDEERQNGGHQRGYSGWKSQPRQWDLRPQHTPQPTVVRPQGHLGSPKDRPRWRVLVLQLRPANMCLGHQKLASHLPLGVQSLDRPRHAARRSREGQT